MPALDLDKNATYGDNWVWRLFIATDYDGSVLASWDWTNEASLISTLDTFTFADVWYFENFSTNLAQWDERVINTDYCGVGVIKRKQDKVPWFSVDVQEILEMENLALILWEELATDVDEQMIVMKRTQKDKPYQLFKFETCPKDGVSNVFYFVRSYLSNDVNIPFNNLAREDFVWVTLEFTVDEWGNYAIYKNKGANPVV